MTTGWKLMNRGRTKILSQFDGEGIDERFVFGFLAGTLTTVVIIVAVRVILGL